MQGSVVTVKSFIAFASGITRKKNEELKTIKTHAATNQYTVQAYNKSDEKHEE